MKKLILAFVAVSALTIAAFEEEEPFSEYYVGAGAVSLIPQGGGNMKRALTGGTLRAGWYAGEFIAVEAEAAWLEHTAGLSLQALWHWWGFERLDPFFTFGARGWINGDAGPSAGAGLFYHFNDEWSIRFDANATLGLDSDVEMVYNVGVGIQRTL